VARTKASSTRIHTATGVGRTRKRPADAPPIVTRYIESSALVAALLEQDLTAKISMRAFGRRVTSALTFAEAARAIVRARATRRLTPAEERAAVRALQVFARRCDVAALTDAVLARVGRPFPVEPIRTLDAVHLATAELLDDAPQLVTIVTRDHRIRENAHALGFAVE
jgi:predicted nucleic acid-binding protein